MLALAAEALINTRQWNYYQRDGQLYPEAKEAEDYILEALELDPENPLAHHLHIHVAEAGSPTGCAISSPCIPRLPLLGSLFAVA
jgi:hypothetical protein